MRSQAETLAAQIIDGVLDSVMSAVAPVSTTEEVPSRAVEEEEEAAVATAEGKTMHHRRRMHRSETEIKVVEIDCTEPEIRISPRRRSVVDQVRRRTLCLTNAVLDPDSVLNAETDLHEITEI